jgi:4-hydroxy-tetrahydrodipicolinate synthase
MTLDGGLWVALATPFLPDGALDLQGFERLVRHVRAGGTDVLVVLGSTGEATALDDSERDAVIRKALAAAGGAPVVVGCTASATAAACRFAAKAQQLGAHGALVATPPYVKPTPAGVVAHFAAIAAAAPSLPLIAYNIPGRTGTNLAPATVQELWRLPAVRGLKESSGDLAQISAIAASLPKDRLLLAGDDPLALPTLALGAHGLVSVAGNVLPAPLRELVYAAREGQLARARAAHERLHPLLQALALEPNPIPLKAALALAGLCGETLRLPLLPAQEATRGKVAAALRALGAIR